AELTESGGVAEPPALAAVYHPIERRRIRCPGVDRQCFDIEFGHWSNPGSYPLDDGRGAHAGADAERDQAGRGIAPFHLVDQRAENDRPGSAARMAEGAGAALAADV